MLEKKEKDIYTLETVISPKSNIYLNLSAQKGLLK